MSANVTESSSTRRTWAKVRELFGADLRSLALFRIVLGILVLGDILLRSTDLIAHYTDAGVLPRDVLLEEGLLDTYDFSINLINGQPFFQMLIFGVGGLAAVGMVLGYRTRLATVVAWIVLISLQNRNPLLLNDGDTLLRVLVFWAMFLPLGAIWSLDRRRDPTTARPAQQFFSAATVALFLQICFMYVFTVILKSGAEWRTDGTALYYALSLEQLATPLGSFLTGFPGLLKILTFSTLALEAFGPFLLFVPLFTGPVRTIVAVAFIGLHLGIWTTMEIGLFPFVSALCMVCFLPAWFWETAWPRAQALTSRFVPQLGRLVPGQMSVLGFSLGAGPTSAIQDAGQNGRRREPPRQMLRSSLETNVLVSLLLAYALWWNLMTVSEFDVPEQLQPVGTTLGISQYWNMFAPYPARSSVWHVIPATLGAGQRVDVMAVTRDDFGLYEISFAKPSRVADVYETNHWRKYMQSISDEGNVDQRLYFGRYLCNAWNARHTEQERLETFEIYEVRQVTELDGSPAEPQRDMLWRHNCA